MNVLHFSTYDGGNGAGRAAYRLHQGIRRAGCRSQMFVRFACMGDAEVSAMVLDKAWGSRWHRSLKWRKIHGDFHRAAPKKPDGYAGFSDDRSPYDRDVLRQIPAADITHLHWVAGPFLDLGTLLPTVASRMPVVWTLHDMNPFTGGCHCDDGCGRHMIKCGSCPQLGSGVEDDLSRQVWLRKQELFSVVLPERLHIVTPSRWMESEAMRTPLLKRFRVTRIPNGVDTDEFSPRDRVCSRDVLRIPSQAFVVLFVANVVSDRHKGFAFLLRALEGLKAQSEVYCVVVGHRPPRVEPPLACRHLGYAGDDRWLSLAYSSADAFMIPSLQDNFPNTVLESMACGTPVIGFDVGGIPDMVRPGVTGLLAPKGDVDGLRNAIVELIQNPALRSTMSSNCRRIVMEEYTLEIQARRYIALYEQLLGTRL